MNINNNVIDIAYLASCAVNNTEVEPERIEKMDIDAIYKIAERHSIKSIVAMALESAGYKDNFTTGAIAAAVRKTVLFDNEWKEIREKFESERIWYMLLKGAVLKEYYPKYGMREFADYDILHDSQRAKDVKLIMEKQGFVTKRFGQNNHDIYNKIPLFNFEMHTSLFDEFYEEKIYKYYNNIENKLIGTKNEKRFKPEDLYLYIVAHEYKHFTNCGTGLRSLLDIYVCLKKMNLDLSYVTSEAKKLGIDGFEKTNRYLAIHLFDNEKMNLDEQKMLNYIIASGTYGNYKNYISNVLRKNRFGKLGYMLKRFIVPISKKNKYYVSFANTYPFFYKYKVLLPILPIYRVIHSIKKGEFKTELHAVLSSDDLHHLESDI